MAFVSNAAYRRLLFFYENLNFVLISIIKWTIIVFNFAYFAYYLNVQKFKILSFVEIYGNTNYYVQRHR
jgi:hypothetical protein